MSLENSSLTCTVSGKNSPINRVFNLERLSDISDLKNFLSEKARILRGDSDEPLLKEPENEFDYFNYKYEDIWNLSKDLERSIWNAKEVDVSKDYDSFDRYLDDNAKHFIEQTIAFFFSSDGIVMNNIDENFLDEIKLPEVRRFFAFQQANELVHSESYGIQLETLIKDLEKRKRLQNAIFEIPTIRQKAQWAQKWMCRERPLAERILAFICVEGIFFSSSFASIYWLRSRYPSEFEGIVSYNDMIARDEALHTKFGCHLYKNYIVNKCSRERILEIFREAYDIEVAFTRDAIPCSMLGINKDTMTTHVESVVNLLLGMIDEEPMFNNVYKSPFTFMNMIALDRKKDFFNHRVTEYQVRTNAVDFTQSDDNW